jgi:hypothetical protein
MTCKNSLRRQTGRHPDLSGHQVPAPDQPGDGKRTQPHPIASDARPPDEMIEEVGHFQNGHKPAI